MTRPELPPPVDPWAESRALAQKIPHWSKPDHKEAVNRWAQAVLQALRKERQT